VAGDALTNARSATTRLADQVLQRQELAPSDEPERGQLTRLDREQCLERLQSHSLGRLAYVARAGVPDVVPVNYRLLGDQLLIRSGPGPKLQAAERRERVAVEVDELDAETRTGWSVVVVGRARRMTTREQHALPPDEQPAPWVAGCRSGLIVVQLDRVDGRQLH
jgi:hypothetical protein